MCGIVGYIGNDQAVPVLLQGLEKLEYRGYDSAGVAVFTEDGLKVVKSKGRLRVLSDLLDGGKALTGTLGIGHTRWATHGAPSDVNSHPQVSEGGRFAVVHNGIIENYLYLKQHLMRRGVQFVSETDTEVVAQMLEYYDKGDILETIEKVISKGAAMRSASSVPTTRTASTRYARTARSSSASGRAKISSRPTFPRSYQRRVRSAA